MDIQELRLNGKRIGYRIKYLDMVRDISIEKCTINGIEINSVQGSMNMIERKGRIVTKSESKSKRLVREAKDKEIKYLKCKINRVKKMNEVTYKRHIVDESAGVGVVLNGITLTYDSYGDVEDIIAYVVFIGSSNIISSIDDEDCMKRIASDSKEYEVNKRIQYEMLNKMLEKTRVGVSREKGLWIKGYNTNKDVVLDVNINNEEIDTNDKKARDTKVCLCKESNTLGYFLDTLFDNYYLIG